MPFDKLGHFCCYALLVFLFLPVVQRQYRETKSRFIAEMVLIGTGIAYGIGIEFVQRLPIVNRSFEVNDMIADALGCFLGYLGYKVISIWILAANKQLV